MPSEFKEYLKKRKNEGAILVAAGVDNIEDESLCVDAACDFILYYPTEAVKDINNRFISGYFAFYDANGSMSGITESQRSLMRHPYIFRSVSALDPFKSNNGLLKAAAEGHYTGIHNYPAYTLIDGTYGDNMYSRDLGLSREIKLVRKASEYSLDACCMVTRSGQAIKMTEAGASVIIFYLGLGDGCYSPGTRDRMIAGDIKRLQYLTSVVRKVSKDIPLLFFSEHVSSVSDICSIITEVPDIDGYLYLMNFDRKNTHPLLSEEVRVIRSCRT